MPRHAMRTRPNRSHPLRGSTSAAGHYSATARRPRLTVRHFACDNIQGDPLADPSERSSDGSGRNCPWSGPTLSARSGPSRPVPGDPEAVIPGRYWRSRISCLDATEICPAHHRAATIYADSRHDREHARVSSSRSNEPNEAHRRYRIRRHLRAIRGTPPAQSRSTCRQVEAPGFEIASCEWQSSFDIDR